MYFHLCISARGCALFLPLEPPRHGRRKTVENKVSNVRYNKINITFPDWVIVENIIPRNMIINLGCASVDNHIPRDDIFDYAPRLIITFLGMIFSTITQSGNVIFI